MTDVPKSPRLPSNVNRQLADTEPPDDSIGAQMSELRKILQTAVEKMSALELRLLQHEIAIRTDEHQTHSAHDRLDSLEKRVRAVEEAQAAE